MMQEDERAKKCYGNTDSISKYDNKNKTRITDKEPNTIDYFLPGPNQGNYRAAGTKITQQLQRELKYAPTGIGSFDGMFSLQVKPDSKPYQAPPRCVAYALQKPFKEE